MGFFSKKYSGEKVLFAAIVCTETYVLVCYYLETSLEGNSNGCMAFNENFSLIVF